MYTSSAIPSPLEIAPLRNFERYDNPLMAISHDDPCKNDCPEFSTCKQTDIMRSYWPSFVMDDKALRAYDLGLESSAVMAEKASRYVQEELSCSDEPINLTDERNASHFSSHRRHRTVSCSSRSTEDQDSFFTPTSLRTPSLYISSGESELSEFEPLAEPFKKKGWDRLRSFGLAHLDLSFLSLRHKGDIEGEIPLEEESPSFPRTPRLHTLDLPSSSGSVGCQCIPVTYTQMYNCRGEPMTCYQISLFNLLPVLGHRE